ncbi:MAG: FAD-dependent oxidoreductase, partial [Patescibacteria group bacterium]|nr:FAD-dependent oxidoreductase [Patescibacteria group bacterium]
MAHAQKRIVIVGAGFGGVYAHRYLHRAFHNSKHISISVVNEQNYFLFTPLLHEVATGGQPRDNIVESLRSELCCLSDLYVERAKEVDPKKRIIAVDGREVPYDYLVLAPGAGTNFFGTPGAEKHAFTLKSVHDAIALKNHIIRCIENASHQEQCKERESRLSFVVVGGGATGVELCAELIEFAKSAFAPLYPNIDLARNVRVILVQSNEELFP